MLSLYLAALLAAGQERILETVLPGADVGPGCSSSMELVNSGSRAASIDLEAHGPTGALVPGGASLLLAPGARKTVALEPQAWVKIRELIPLPRQGPVVSARRLTECAAGDRLRTVQRDAAFTMRNPWFAGDAGPAGAFILFINAAETPAFATGCYSSGNFYAVPRSESKPPPFEPLCSETFNVEVPPFAAREFPVERNGSRWFCLQTRGPSIVLEMLRPAVADDKLFVVDSTIRFGSEVTSR